MRTIFFILLLSTLAFSYSTKSWETRSYPQNDFISPVKHSIYLAGTFGELRSNHFHAGIDIKSSNGKTGDPLFCIADGFVSRIKVASGGYGNVLYIDHPNGYTSVYAHLAKFPKQIQDFVEQRQYEKQTFELELFPNSDQFQLKQGDPIGTMGISGRSFGPHLHFEIRDTRTEKPINPLLFGFKVRDKIKPKLHELKIYYLNKKRETLQTKTYNLQKSGGKYRIKGDTAVIGAWRVGFAIKAYDHMDGVPNWNGVYSVDMYNEDSLWYNYTMETFSFDETRYINAHLDYEEQVSKKSYFNRCYELPGNELNIYKEQTNNGVVALNKNRRKKINMLVSDVDGNTSELEFWIRRDKVKEVDSPTFNYILPYDEANMIDNGSMKLYFPKGAFYENVYMQYQSSMEKSDGVYSAVHHIHNYKTPVHTYYDISIKPTQIIESLKDKMYIAYCDKENEVTNCGGEWDDGMLKAKVRDMGDYCIMADEISPIIKPVNFKRDMRGFNKMSFKITDNIATARNVDGLKYEATVDGQWILMEYDAKNDLLSHRFDNRVNKGEHLFTLKVWDECGNVKKFEETFIR